MVLLWIVTKSEARRKCFRGWTRGPDNEGSGCISEEKEWEMQQSGLSMWKQPLGRAQMADVVMWHQKCNFLQVSLVPRGSGRFCRQ